MKSMADKVIPFASLKNWRDDLITHEKSGEVICRAHNLILILENADEFKGRIKYNEFSEQICIDKIDIEDSMPIVIKSQLEKSYINEKIGTTEIIDALGVVAKNNKFHPVKEYLNSLAWDGVPRIQHFFYEACGCDTDIPYFPSAARCFFISAVRRIFEPACKADSTLILEGDQGRKKSTLFITLFGEWYMEITESVNNKDFFQCLLGSWGADFGELDQFSKAETSRIKLILTAPSDKYRQSYGRFAKKYLRQNVFVGSTNHFEWLTDETGGRRFLPVKVEKTIDIEWVAKNRDQLWAESVHLLNQFYLQEFNYWDVDGAKEQQELRQVGDSWELRIAAYLSEKSQVTVTEIFENALSITDDSKHTRSDQTRIGKIMTRQKNNGWVKRQVTINAIPKQWAYVKIQT